MVVTHETSAMTSMENPTERFCQIIRRVENACDVVHDNVLCSLPVLNGKMLHRNVVGAFRGNPGVDHVDSGLVVFRAEKRNGTKNNGRTADQDPLLQSQEH